MLRRKIATALTLVLLISSVVTGSFAEYTRPSYENEADSLKAMGLFAGTNNGYELDRTPTRAEAATMLVKLLGGEAEAKAKNYKHPFTDVPSWANPFVGYMYEKKLTAGMGNNLYGSNALTQSKDYATFVLKALGYSADTDFKYDKAVSYAVSRGVLTSDDVGAMDYFGFTRNEMVHISFGALKTPLKGQTIRLIDSLVSKGAVSDASAKAEGMVAPGEIYKLGVTIKGGTFDVNVADLDPELLSEITYITETGTDAPNRSDVDFALAYFLSTPEMERILGKPGQTYDYHNREYSSLLDPLFLFLDENGVALYSARIPRGLASGSYTFDIVPTTAKVRSLMAEYTADCDKLQKMFMDSMLRLDESDLVFSTDAAGDMFVTVNPSKIDPTKYAYYTVSSVFTDNLDTNINLTIEYHYKFGLGLLAPTEGKSTLPMYFRGVMQVVLYDELQDPIAIGVFDTDR